VAGNAQISRDMHVQTLAVPGYTATVYRTTSGHQITAGCQTFTIDDGLEALAQLHAPELVPLLPLLIPAATALVALVTA
jgi:hypothetical protein